MRKLLIWLSITYNKIGLVIEICIFVNKYVGWNPKEVLAETYENEINKTMEQFLTGDIWKKVNKLFIKREKKTACIAYVTLENLHLSKGDILICDASDYEIKFGATSAKVNSYFKKGVLIYSKQDLHSKLLLTNSFLAIGSANLSNKSVDTLVESVIVTENNILLSQATAFCNNLKNEATLLTRAHLDRILKIKVVKRPLNQAQNPRRGAYNLETGFGMFLW